MDLHNLLVKHFSSLKFFFQDSAFKVKLTDFRFTFIKPKLIFNALLILAQMFSEFLQAYS
jgi:hypothetical protein